MTHHDAWLIIWKQTCIGGWDQFSPTWVFYPCHCGPLLNKAGVKIVKLRRTLKRNCGLVVVNVLITRNFFVLHFWLIAVIKIRNNRPQRLASSRWPFFCALKLRFGAQKVSPLSARLKWSCNIAVTMKTMKTRRQLWWRKEESTEKKGWTYCVAGASNYVRYKNKTHISGIFIYCFPKNVAVWPKWTRFDHRHRGDLTLQCRLPYAPYRLRRRLLRTHTNSQIRGGR